MIAGLPVSRTANHSQPSEMFIRELIVFQGKWIYAGFSIIILSGRIFAVLGYL
jgi:hypothetical protein